MPNPLLLVIGVVVGAALGALVAYVWLGSVRRQRDLVSTAEREKLLSDAETQMKEMVLEAKEEAHRIRMNLEQEVRDARAEIQRSERRDVRLGGGHSQRRDEGPHHRSRRSEYPGPGTRDRGRPDHR